MLSCPFYNAFLILQFMISRSRFCFESTKIRFFIYGMLCLVFSQKKSLVGWSSGQSVVGMFSQWLACKAATSVKRGNRTIQPSVVYNYTTI